MQPVAAPATVQTSHALHHTPYMNIHAALGSNLLKIFLDWPCAVQAIIYVVDSSDTERIGTSAEEFHAILDEEELRDALILVYANKQASALLCVQQTAIPGHADPLGRDWSGRHVIH